MSGKTLAGRKGDPDRSPLPDASLSAVSERDMQPGSPVEDFPILGRTKKLSNNCSHWENPFLLNNLATRLDLPSFSLKN